MADAGILDYGALGVLAALLGALILGAREWFKRDDVRQRARDAFLQDLFTQQATVMTTIANSLNTLCNAQTLFIDTQKADTQAQRTDHTAILAAVAGAEKATKLLGERLRQAATGKG